MSRSVALLRGINVGGRNPVKMAALADAFTAAGCDDVQTYLQSGNVVFSGRPGGGPRAGAAAADSDAETAIERMLLDDFGIPILVVVRTRDEFAATIAEAPADHGSETLRSDVYFLKAPLTVDEVWPQLPELREGVDSIAPGPGALYFSRVAAVATKTRIQKLLAMPVFQQMTVRSWRTVVKLGELLEEG